MASRKNFYIFIIGLALIGGATTIATGKFIGTPPAYSEGTLTVQTLKPFKKDSLDKIVKNRNGKPFVLAFWSVYCAICIQEMEIWREVRDQRPDFDLVLVTTDPIKEEQRINQVLQREDMHGFELWAFADPIPARLRNVVDSKWRGELPRIHFYNDNGVADVRMGKVGKNDVLDWLGNQDG